MTSDSGRVISLTKKYGSSLFHVEITGVQIYQKAYPDMSYAQNRYPASQFLITSSDLLS